ncbi:substrate-binding periplasmic protein [Paucidesulfovibrio longus]|uniref:substrate-binding periplasmic protein n=1 Tax=Paucidesulfovibrio longus TaxID=889 RepID=UPI0003B455A7|nr:transporter substrate-binding domain-containing protein [Paucidesulfovibrio longus]
MVQDEAGGQTPGRVRTDAGGAVRRLAKVCILAVLLLLPCAAVSAASDAAESAPPLMVYTEESAVTRLADGRIAGFFVELVREMLRRAHLNAEIQVVPWKRAYVEAQDRPNVLLFPTAYIPERKDLFHWLDPVFRVRWIFYSKHGDALRVRSLDDARLAKGIAVYREDVRHQYLRWLGFSNLVVVDSTAQGWRMLLQGRVALLAASDASVSETDYAERLDRSTLDPALTLSESVLHPVLSLDSDPALVRACDKALKSMFADGTYERIFRRWYAARDYAPQKPKP